MHHFDLREGSFATRLQNAIFASAALNIKASKSNESRVSRVGMICIALIQTTKVSEATEEYLVVRGA